MMISGYIYTRPFCKCRPKAKEICSFVFKRRTIFGKRTFASSVFDKGSFAPATSNQRFFTSSALNIQGNYSDIYIKDQQNWPKSLLESFLNVSFPCCSIQRDFVTEEEEKTILSEVEPRFKRLRYEKSHWDDAIYLYRETEKTSWTQDASIVLNRIRQTAFPADCQHISYVHVLDLHKDGHIKPHIDSVRYCGDVISGICLLSDAVMRLVHKDTPSLTVDLMLPRRSFYLLRGPARYDFTHEVLSNDVSYFCGVHVPKGIDS